MALILGQDFTDRLLQVRKIDDHATLNLSFNSNFEFVSVAVQGSTLRVTGEKMGAVDVFGHTNPHGVRIT